MMATSSFRFSRSDVFHDRSGFSVGGLRSQVNAVWRLDAEGLEKRVNRLLKPSRVFGVFPYVARGGRFRSSLARHAGLQLPAWILASVPVLAFLTPRSPEDVRNLAFVVLPSSGFALLLLVNALHLPLSRSSLDIFLRSLKSIQMPSTSRHLPFPLIRILSLVINLPVLLPSVTGPFQFAQLIILELGGTLSAATLDPFAACLPLISYQLLTLRLVDVESARTLATAARALTNAFAPQVLVALAYLFLNAVVRMYYLMKDDSSILVIHLVEIAILLWPVWRIITLSENLVAQVDKFEEEIYRLLIRKKYWTDADRRLAVELKVREPLSLTICGLIGLNFPLLHSMLATCATYLVVLVQFTS